MSSTIQRQHLSDVPCGMPEILFKMFQSMIETGSVSSENIILKLADLLVQQHMSSGRTMFEDIIQSKGPLSWPLVFFAIREQKYVGLAKFLLENHPPLLTCIANSQHKDTALHIACSFSNREIVKYILLLPQVDELMMIEDGLGWTPLDVALHRLLNHKRPEYEMDIDYITYCCSEYSILKLLLKHTSKEELQRKREFLLTGLEPSEVLMEMLKEMGFVF